VDTNNKMKVDKSDKKPNKGLNVLRIKIIIMIMIISMLIIIIIKCWHMDYF